MPSVSQHLSSMSVLKLALLTQQHATTRELLRAEPIAILGAACRFPAGADTPERFWKLLCDGVDAVREVPGERWNAEKLYDADPSVAGKVYTRYGSFLDQVDQFDPAFFGISPREAAMMDPQQRLLLEVGWESLEYAGIPPAALQGKAAGIFIGMMAQDYAYLSASALGPIDAYTGTGNLISVAAGRMAYFFGCHGPALTVDTACSSSLVTVHLACQSLRQAECDIALAGGVNLLLTPHHSVMQSRARMLSCDGRCKTFDAAADGMGRGEGCGIVVLKRLADAVADGDTILAVIRGSAVNHDGRSSGLTVPNGLAQQRVIRQALESGGVSPELVSYVEAHGSGTSLGDPIEVEALGAVYGQRRETPLMLGSVKTNLGHLEGAAGIAGLMKVILALQHKEIPAHLHLEHPNPHIPWSTLPIRVPTAHETWAVRGPRLAGVSSFGASGTNAHLILEEAPALPAAEPDREMLQERPLHLVVLSAATAEALTALARRYVSYFADHPDVALADIAYTASLGRSHLRHRLSVVASTPGDCSEKLAAWIAGRHNAGVSVAEVAPERVRIAFLFTGQGAQYVQMGRQLYETHRVFRDALDRCDAILRRYLEHPLLDVFYPRDQEPGEPASTTIDTTAYAQPALFALEYALAMLWQSWGIQPEVLMGHSSGEYAAACVAGVFSLEDGLRLIAERARIIQSEASDGATAAVFANAGRVADLLGDYDGSICIAAINGPEETLIAGAACLVEAALAAWRAIGIDSRRLRISHATHSPLIEPGLPMFEPTTKAVTYHSPRIKLISNLTGELLQQVDGAYWLRHMREPVQFASGMQQLQAAKCDAIVEIGPQPVLLWLGRQNWSGPRRVTWLPSLWGIRSDWEQLLQSLGELYVRGADVDWAGLYDGEDRHSVALPTYAFQRQRYWVDTQTSGAQFEDRKQDDPQLHPLLGRRIQSAALQQGEIQFENRLSSGCPSWLADHRVFERVVLPGAAYIEIACEAAENILNKQHFVLENVAIHRPLVLPRETADVTLQCLVTPRPWGHSWEIYAAAGNAESFAWTLHAEGSISIAPLTQSLPIDWPALEAEIATAIDIQAFYSAFEARQIQYGAHFRLIQHLWSTKGKALGRVSLPADLMQQASLYQLHPVLLDACFQVSAAIFMEEPDTWLPIGVERFELLIKSPEELRTEVWCEARLCSIKSIKSMQPIELMNPDAPSVDLRLFTPDGRLLAEVHGLQLKRPGRQAILGKDSHHDWLYQVEWQAQERLSVQPPQHHAEQLNAVVTDALVAEAVAGGRAIPRWLLFAEDEGFAREFTKRLNHQHHQRATVVVVYPGQRYEQVDPSTFRIDPTCKADYLAVAASVPHLERVIYGWPAMRRQDEGIEGAAEFSEGAPEAACVSLLYLVQTTVELPRPPQLFVVTQGAAACPGAVPSVSAITLRGLMQSPLWGMAKVIALEHPEVRCVRADLDPAASPQDSAEMLVEELISWSQPVLPDPGLSQPIEDQIAYRGTARYAARLARLSVQEHNIPLRLAMTVRGSLDRLHLQPVERRLPRSHEVEIRVHATGLNFRDVLNVLGMYPGDPGSVGNECSGEVTAVGPAVDGLSVGDNVIALVDDGFGHFVTVAANRVVLKPEELSFDEAATIPIAFLTAVYCLDHVARIQPGERVLIHTATGGFGQAAIQLARRAKAEIFATASRDKWAALRDLGVDRIYDSRALDFATDVLNDTGGKGVDIVLNTLTGPGCVEANLAALAANGRFVEVSKRNVWDAERIAGVRPDITYVLVDLAEMTAKQPGAVQKMLQGLMPGFEDRSLFPLPVTSFPLRDVVSAFRLMQHARHIGKIVVVPSASREIHIREDGTYLVTGGLGGLGLVMARWLVQQGATHVMLMGRRAPNQQALRQVDELRHMGAAITIMHADIADRTQLAHALAAIDPALPLRGVLHAAGLLDDGALINQNATRFGGVLAPKVQGGWNLHALTADLPVDFFVLFSSIASMLGAAGQANHAAANAFLDSLAHYRRSMGLPALSINWGAWSEVGNAASLVSQLRRQGMGAISPQEGQQIFGQLWNLSSAQVGVLPIDWARYSASTPFLSAFERTGAAPRHESIPLLQRLLALPVAQQQPRLVQHIRSLVAEILGHASGAAVSTSQGFRELGMDSLTSLELRNRLQTSLECQLPAGVVFNYPTVEAVAGYVMQHVVSVRLPNTALPAPQQSPEPYVAKPTLSPETPAPLLMREGRVKGKGISLCVCEWGYESNPAIVCLHGTRDHGASWEAVAEALVAEGHRVIAHDLRGHGRSGHTGPHETYHLRDFVADLDCLLRQLDASPLPLVAHSFGSMIAVLYASIRPERISSLVLVEPPLPAESFAASTFTSGIAAHMNSDDATPQHPLMADINIAAERLRQVTPSMSQSTSLRMAERQTTPLEGGIVWAWDARLDSLKERIFAGLTRGEYLSMLARISVPVTVVYGASSGWIRVTDRDHIQAALPAVRPVILSGGHNLHLDTAADLAVAILEAVKRTEMVGAGAA